MSKHKESQKQRWQAQEALVKVLSFVYVGGAYGLIAVAFVQAYILVSWLQN